MKKFTCLILCLTISGFLFGLTIPDAKAYTSSTVEKLLQMIEDIQKKITEIRAQLAKLKIETVSEPWSERSSLVKAFDFNDDGVFNSNDVARLTEATGDETLQMEGMDLNGNGVINMGDVVLLQNIYYDFNSNP